MIKNWIVILSGLSFRYKGTPTDINDFAPKMLFLLWVKNKSGNVYNLLKWFLQLRFPKEHLEVGVDWMAWRSKHDFDVLGGAGAWRNWDKQPRWFEEWINKNATNKWKTDYNVKQNAKSNN